MCNKPCRECPWRKNSIPGWLGASTPLEFLDLSESEARMPCHLTVDYERDDWEEQIKTAPQCAGRAIYFANRCKVPKNRELIVLEADRENVFTDPEAFYRHHGGKHPLILMFGRFTEQRPYEV